MLKDNLTTNIKMTYDKVFDPCYKFKIELNSKLPSYEWKKPYHNRWNKTKHKQGNWGLPMGASNNLMGFDPDLYKWGKDHKFVKDILKGRSWDEYIKDIDTLTVATPNGGYHFLFNYEGNNLRNKNCSLHEIDIKTAGSYLVGCGSIVFKRDKKTKGAYTLKHKATVKDMPKELYEWLFNNLSYKHNKQGKKTKKTDKTSTLSGEILEDAPYQYLFTDNQLQTILDSLPESYILNHENWLKTATAFKGLNKAEFFLEYCLNHSKTNCKIKNDEYYRTNVNLINGITQHHNLDMITHLLTMTDIKEWGTWLDYGKHKPIKIEPYKSEPIIIENVEKLGYEVDIDPNKNYILKSDTGTGKTTIVKDYIFNNQQPLISIVSRVSLAYSQYSTFNSAGVEIYHYKLMENELNQDDSIVITIDSIHKILDLDFTNYVVFLDEYNSLVEYLLTCPNLKDKRIVCFTALLKLIRECKQIIAVDADIHYSTLKLMDYCGRDYEFIENTYKHNSNIPATEVYSYEALTYRIKQEKEALVCCDSKSACEVIFKDLIDYHRSKTNCIVSNMDEVEEDIQTDLVKASIKYEDSDPFTIVLITSDTNEEIELDDYDIVIFSPKIVYGLDSVRKRRVYANYKEHTINPKAMMQQICRNRNITELVYIFHLKAFSKENYSTFSQIEEEKKKTDEAFTFKLMCSKEDNALYNEMVNIIKYNEDCYNTNKFAHFRKALQTKGFIDNTDYKKTDYKELNDKVGGLVEEKMLNFDSTNPKHDKINSYLNIPQDKMHEHLELYVKPNTLTTHFNINNYFFKSKADWKVDLITQNDFSGNKGTDKKNKYIFLETFLNDIGITDKVDLNFTKGLTEDKAEDTYKKYQLLFRDRAKKKPDLKTVDGCEKVIISIYRRLFGKDIIDTVRNKSKTQAIYTVSFMRLDYHRDIIQYKNPDINHAENIDFSFGREHTVYGNNLDSF